MWPGGRLPLAWAPSLSTDTTCLPTPASGLQTPRPGASCTHLTTPQPVCPTFSPILHSPATPPYRGLEGTCALPSVTDPAKRHEQESSSLGTTRVEDSRVLCTWSEVQRGTIRGTRQGPLSPQSRAVPPKVSDCSL